MCTAFTQYKAMNALSVLDTWAYFRPLRGITNKHPMDYRITKNLTVILFMDNTMLKGKKAGCEVI